MAGGSTLDDFRRAHPQLAVLPAVESPTGRSTDATGTVCFRTSAVDGLVGALWAPFQTDDASEASTERVAAF